MTKQRIALIFDNVIRPETTGGYCLRALEKLHHVQHFRPDQLDQIPRSGFDLYLNIDEGLRYHLPQELRPCAWWVIDTHLAPEWAENKGRGFDFVFAAQRNGAERLNAAGIPTYWLPLACDPELHRRFDCEKCWDICFIGNTVGSPRDELIDLIQQRFPRTFVGKRYFEEFAQTYSQAKIGFNRSILDDINMRVFETAACGSLLVSNDLRDNGQEELLVSDKHLVTYRGEEELLEKLRFYLDHQQIREKIAAAGHSEVVARHTYLHRMHSILQVTARTSCVPVVADVPTAPRQFEMDGEQNHIVENAASNRSPQSELLDAIDFVIKTFLRPKALLRLLRSIEEFYPGAKVSVADDGGLREATDFDSRECCRLIDAQPNWTLLLLPFAAGVAVGRNLLIDSTSRPFVLLLDDDFCLTSQTKIERFVELLQSHDKVGVAAGCCIDIINNERRPRQSGGTLDLVDTTLVIKTGAWRDAASGLREYVPQFGLVRRDVFSEIRWDGGIDAEHYDFLLQLMSSRWKVMHDLSVQIDHYPLTESLPGYTAHRFNYQENQQWLLRKWGLRKIVQDGQTIIVAQSIQTDGPDVRDTSRSARAGTSKDMPYFEFSRPEVVALIPTTARRVLDIGCAAGRLGQLLKQRQSVHVTGLELNPVAARIARQSLEQVLEVNVEDSEVDFADGSFDCIVCADVLEHLRDPSTVLGRIRRWLAPGGRLVISLPNVRHHSVVAALLDGNWTYESAGLLDNDHMRFFTRREIEKLLFRTGFGILNLLPVLGNGHAEWERAGRPGSVRIGPMKIEGRSPDDAEEFFTYQYLVVAEPLPAMLDEPQEQSSHSGGREHSGQIKFGLTSIIIVTFNQIPYTRECVESIRLRTDEPYELIFVDNGSTDGTPNYLQTISEAKVILNAENRGFPAAVNQGLQQARGEQILLLNNDTVVSTGWLQRLLTVFHRNPNIGLVGPCSNSISGSQLIPVTYGDLASMDGFAWELGKQYAGRIEGTDRLIGFCLLIRRSVIEQIGGLDERFGIGCFEDDDLCLRAIQAGWKVVIARDSFVHHYGSRTFRASGTDFAGLMKENQIKFREKWASTASTTSAIRTQFSIAEAEGGGLRLVPADRPHLSLCMIVRNNENTIGPCLESIRPWVDEMIVIDTGSTDATPEICERLGATVHHWAWRDDFSAARNESLKHARGQWLFWMDSDDTISEACGRQLRALANGDHAENTLGYVIQVHCPGPGNDGNDVTAVDHVKLFRNRPDLRFEHRIHEQILPAIRRAGGEVAFTDIYVVHSGADHTADGRQRKLERDFKLLRLDLDERPNHPFVLFNLGMTHADCQQLDEAVQFLTQCLEVSFPTESHVRKAYALLVTCLTQKGDLNLAWTTCSRAREQFPSDKELLFRQAMLAHELGQLDAAAALYIAAMAPSSERHFSSIDTGISGFKARHNLALVYEDQGRFDLAEKEWMTIVSEKRDYVAAHLGIVDCLLRRQDTRGAATWIERLRAIPSAQKDALRMTVRLAETERQWGSALRELERGRQQYGDDAGLLQDLARIQYSCSDYGAAAETLERLQELVPNNASAWHNYGVVLAQLARHSEAEKAFEHANGLQRRGRVRESTPNSGVTAFN